MAVLITLILVALSVGIIALPLLRSSRSASLARPRRSTLPDSFLLLEELLRQRQAVYEEINTLRLEYELGNVPSEEYTARLQESRRHAALLLKKQEVMTEQLTILEEELEEQVQRARQALKGKVAGSPAGEKGY